MFNTSHIPNNCKRVKNWECSVCVLVAFMLRKHILEVIGWLYTGMLIFIAYVNISIVATTKEIVDMWYHIRDETQIVCRYTICMEWARALIPGAVVFIQIIQQSTSFDVLPTRTERSHFACRSFLMLDLFSISIIVSATSGDADSYWKPRTKCTMRYIYLEHNWGYIQVGIIWIRYWLFYYAKTAKTGNGN